MSIDLNTSSSSAKTTLETTHDLNLNFLSPEQIFELEQATMNIDLDTLYWSTELESLGM